MNEVFAGVYFNNWHFGSVIFTATCTHKKTTLYAKSRKRKNEAILQVKTKELTAYALQMIEKDKALNELLESIKAHSPADFAALNHKHTTQSSKLVGGI